MSISLFSKHIKLMEGNVPRLIRVTKLWNFLLSTCFLIIVIHFTFKRGYAFISQIFPLLMQLFEQNFVASSKFLN